MATIPIEVIVQDAEVPVPETNTETNIAVPDTGAGTLGSNTFSGSSAVNIIIPAVLLVLALATVCTLLIRRHHKHQGDKASKKEKLATSASATIVVLAAITLVSNLILPATKAATSDTTDTITPSGDKISITVTRDSGSAEASVESTATTTSTSDFDYKVLLSMAEGVETSNLYLNGDTSSEHYISSTESTELGNNTWGFALTEDGEYSAVPLLDDAVIVAQGSEPVEDETLSIYYGVKVSSDLPAGTYSGVEIEYTLEAKEPTLPISYMQDFATLSEEDKTVLISSMPEGYQFTLKDSRDQKEYFISKLADGNVWMTQNLDLDLSTETALTPTNTNIFANWAPANSTVAFAGTTVDGWQNNNNVPYSADPGELYIYSSGTVSNDEQYASLEACRQAHSDCNMHNHAGNYYNWSAAVANNNTENETAQFANLDTDICPAGWELPKSKQSSDDQLDGNKLGILLNSSGILGPEDCGGTCYSYADSGFNTVRKAPLWLVRSGDISNGSLSGATNSGDYWSSTVSSSSGAYYLHFDHMLVLPANAMERSYGRPVRCLAK